MIFEGCLRDFPGEIYFSFPENYNFTGKILQFAEFCNQFIQNSSITEINVGQRA
jgi:hypothetical protein